MDDLIGEFITETSESLSVLDMELVKLEQNPNDTAILSNIFRLVHTIKGTCGFLGLPRLEHVAHAAENVLGRIRDQEIDVTPGRISIVLESLDHIKYLLDHLAENGTEPEGNDQDLINRLNAHASGQSDEEVAAGSAGAQADDAPAAQSAEAEDGLSDKERAELEAARNEPSIEDILADLSIVADTSDESEAVADAEVPQPAAEVPVAQEKPAAKPAAVLEDDVKTQAVKEGLQAGAKEASTGGGPAAAANQSIRVNLGVLENLMQMVGELVLTRNQLMQVVRNRDDNELKTPLQHLSHITTELQEGIMKTRMQPIGNAWAKFPRLIRDLSLELGKKIELRMEGAETELDRQLLEMIKDPLTHMVRNSCDHGLEGPADRKGAGKSETGTVTLSAYHEGGHIIIKIQDDGRGVNIERVSQKAVENGLATEAEIAEMSDQQIAQFIFHAGFSTAAAVTSVSGRGVGMDVVRTNIEKIGGTVELQSEPGRGSIFNIKIPLTLAIVSVLIVESGAQRFAIPQINVLELVQTSDDSEYKIETINGAQVLRLRGKLLPLVPLNDVLHLPEAPRDGPLQDERFIVVCKVGNSEFGVIVERIFDTEEIVVKPVSELLKDISVFSGNTILGDGSVIMILDPNGLSRLTGEAPGANNDSTPAARAQKVATEQIVSFLLFASGNGAPKAVPLELVSRLEEIDVSKVEFSGTQKVIQYRGDLMRLTSLEGTPDFGERTMCDVIVFTYDSKTIGLVVDEILDIVEAPLKVKRGTENEAYVGSMVIAGKTTDVVDVGFLLRGMIDDLLLADLDITGNSRSAKIMLVEDSIFFRKLTIPLLSNVGYKVTDYPDPIEALEGLRNAGEIDLIVTDIEMPGMDGFQFAERVREDERYDHIPIIAFTSTMNNHFSARAKQVGMSDLILKTDREALLTSIQKQLDNVREMV